MFPRGPLPWNESRDVGGGEGPCPPASCLEPTASPLGWGLRKWVYKPHPTPSPPSWTNSVFSAAGEGGWQTESPVLTRGRAEPSRRSCDKAKRGQGSGLSSEFWLPPFWKCPLLCIFKRTPGPQLLLCVQGKLMEQARGTALHRLVLLQSGMEDGGSLLTFFLFY